MITFFLLFHVLVAVQAASASDLRSFLDLVESKNLELHSQKSLINAASERSKGLNLPPPMIGVSQMRNLQGESYAFEVQQQVPLSSKLFDDKDVRAHRFDLQKNESRYFSDSLLLEARLSFVSFWVLFEKLKLIEDLRDWLKEHVKYAQSLARSDTELRIHVLEIESSIGLYDNEINTLKNQLEEEKVKLRGLVFDSAYDPGAPELGPLKEIPTTSGVSRVSEIDNKRLNVALAQLEVAKSANNPNLFLKFKKLDRPMIGMANQEIMVGIDLPFAYFWQGRAEKAEASAEKAMAEARYRKTVVQSEALKESLKRQLVLTQDQLRNLDRVSIPAADKRLVYLKNISPRDINGLNSHYKIFQDSIELKTQRVEARLRYEELYTRWMTLFGEPIYATK